MRMTRERWAGRAAERLKVISIGLGRWIGAGCDGCSLPGRAETPSGGGFDGSRFSSSVRAIREGFLRCPRGNGSGPSLGGVPGCGRRSLRRSSASRLNRSPAGSLRAARPGVGGPCRSDRECNRYALRQAKAAARQVRPTDQPGFWRAAGPSIPPSGGGHPRNPDAKASLVQTLFSGDNTVCSFPRRRPRRSCSMCIRAGSAWWFPMKAGYRRSGGSSARTV